MTHEQLRSHIWQQGRELYRDMPWRRDTRGYYVLVSELMLQQTQVSRVIPKFEQFIAAFPDESTLANAELADVLKLWQGLGYNRRAKFLLSAARMIATDLGGRFPDTEPDLLRLPGVGKNTAGAILAYTFNQPSIFIETNIRTVLIHHLFADQDEVADVEIRLALEATLDREHPREFYWAMMDYGAHLKAQGIRTNARSKHYKKQSKLEGSVRQVRGQIVAALTQHGAQTEDQLREYLRADERFEPALRGLVKDELVVAASRRIALR